MEGKKDTIVTNNRVERDSIQQRMRKYNSIKTQIFSVAIKSFQVNRRNIRARKQNTNKML